MMEARRKLELMGGGSWVGCEAGVGGLSGVSVGIIPEMVK